MPPIRRFRLSLCSHNKNSKNYTFWSCPATEKKYLVFCDAALTATRRRAIGAYQLSFGIEWTSVNVYVMVDMYMY